MRMLITELIPDGQCEFSGKKGECLKVVLDAGAPPAIVSTKKFIELVRFQAQQQAKRSVQEQPAPTRPAADRANGSRAAATEMAEGTSP